MDKKGNEPQQPQQQQQFRFSSIFSGRDLHAIVDQISLDSPFKDKEKVDSVQHFASKLNQLRNCSPKSVTSDAANILGTMYNSKLYGRKTVQGYMCLLLDRMLELSNYWTLTVDKLSNNTNTNTTNSNTNNTTNATVGHTNNSIYDLGGHNNNNDLSGKGKECNSSSVSTEMTQDSCSIENNTTTTNNNNTNNNGAIVEWKDFDSMEREDLIQQLTQLQDEVKRYSEIIHHAETRCNNYEIIAQAKEELEQQVLQLQQENKEIQMNVVTEFASLRQEKTLLLKDLARARQELVEMIQAHRHASDVVEERIISLEDAAQARDQLAEAMNQLQQQLKSCQSEYECLTRAKTTVEEELHSSQHENVILTKRIAQLTLQLESTDKAEARLVSVLQAKNAAEKRGRELEEMIHTMKENKIQLEELVDKKEKKVKKLSAHKEVLVRECVTLRNEVSCLKESIQGKEDEVNRLHHLIVEETRISSEREAELRNQLSLLQLQLQEEKNGNQPMKDKMTSLLEEKKRILNTLENCQRKLAEKEDQLSITIRELLELQVAQSDEALNPTGPTATGIGKNKLLSFSFPALQLVRNSLYKGNEEGRLSPMPSSSQSTTVNVREEQQVSSERIDGVAWRDGLGSNGMATNYQINEEKHEDVVVESSSGNNSHEEQQQQQQQQQSAHHYNDRDVDDDDNKEEDNDNDGVSYNVDDDEDAHAWSCNMVDDVLAPSVATNHLSLSSTKDHLFGHNVGLVDSDDDSMDDQPTLFIPEYNLEI